MNAERREKNNVNNVNDVNDVNNIVAQTKFSQESPTVETTAQVTMVTRLKERLSWKEKRFKSNHEQRSKCRFKKKKQSLKLAKSTNVNEA